MVGLYFTWSPLGLIVIITRLSRELQKIILIHIQRNFRGGWEGSVKSDTIKIWLEGSDIEGTSGSLLNKRNGKAT